MTKGPISKFLLFLMTAVSAGPVLADSFNSLTAVGNGLIIQSLSASRHLMKPDPEESNIFLRRRLEQDEEEGVEHFYAPPEPTAYVWNLGYIGTRAAGTVDSAYSHNFTGGLLWEALDVLDLSVGLTIETTPSSDYRGGSVDLHGGYLFFIGDRPQSRRRQDRAARLKEEEELPDHLRHTKGYVDEGEPDYTDEELAALLDGPTLLVKTNLIFTRHQQSSTVDQSAYGLEGIWSPDPVLSLRAGFLKNSFNDSVAGFAGGGTSGLARQGIARLSGVAGHSATLQSYPQWIFEGGLNVFGDSMDFNVGGNVTLYELGGSTILGEAGLGHLFGKEKKVRGGLGGSFVTGGGSSAILGILTISYAL